MVHLKNGLVLFSLPDQGSWDGSKTELIDFDGERWSVIIDDNFRGKMTTEDIKEEFFVNCFRCNKLTPYSPPSPPEQTLCDECSKEPN